MRIRAESGAIVGRNCNGLVSAERIGGFGVDFDRGRRWGCDFRLQAHRKTTPSSTLSQIAFVVLSSLSKTPPVKRLQRLWIATPMSTGF